MFHLNTVTNECGIFMERNYGEGVVLAPDPDWTVGYRIDHRKRLRKGMQRIVGFLRIFIGIGSTL